MVFAQQSAADLATDRVGQLSGKIRVTWVGTFLLWLVAAGIVWFLQDPILERWRITNAAALWVTVLVGLGSLWMPMFLGLLQGKQDFLWLGWATILNGVVRLGGAALLVFFLNGNAAGILAGVMAGLSVAALIGIWRSRKLWLHPVQPFDWGELCAKVIPIMLGFAACQFVFTSDTIFVNAFFSDEKVTAPYLAAGTLSRALVWVVGPITSVMFPKVVHSTARSEKVNLLGLTLACTGVLAGGGAIALYILGPLLLKVWPVAYLPGAMAVLPWYAAAMVPLSLANVMVNNLLARSQFKVVAVLVLLALSYGVTLSQVHNSLIQVLQILGIFNAILLAVCVWFTWGPGQGAKVGAA
jgi:O-antigen/teichoic acid export membrane protein